MTDQVVERIRNYTYASKDASVMSKYYYPICKFILEFIPLSISPNVITLFGMFTVMFSTFLLSFEISSISIAFSSLCLLIYQLCDALDGMQGKRTNMYYNPTTEIFDHGCDSIVVTLSLINFLLIFKPSNFAAIITFICVTSIFYFPTWEHLHTKIMNFRPLLCNPTESLFALEVSYLVLALCPQFIRSKVVLYGIILMQALHAVYVIYDSTKNVLSSNMSTLVSKIKTLFPMLLVIYLLIHNSSILDMYIWISIATTWNYAVLELIWSEITGMDYNIFGFIAIFAKQLLFPHDIILNIFHLIHRSNKYVNIMCENLNMKYFWTLPINERDKLHN